MINFYHLSLVLIFTFLSGLIDVVVRGWNDSVKSFKEAAVFWKKLWVQADCPSPGILFDLCKCTKNEYKYAVRCVKRQCNHIIRKLHQLFSVRTRLCSGNKSSLLRAFPPAVPQIFLLIILFLLLQLYPILSDFILWHGYMPNTAF